MHHVPYTHVLHSGKTVIQHVYDSHYDAAAEAQEFPVWWKTLRGRIDDERYYAVLAKLEYQAGHAIVWRDAICSWFLHESGIADDKGRAGHFPNRVEAESMRLDGYEVKEVAPWEDASGGKAVSCELLKKSCSASFVFTGTPGWYDLDIQYFDENSGAARFQLEVANQLVKTWTANASLPARAANGDSSTRKSVAGLALRPNDEIRITGTPDGDDHASLDYVEIKPRETNKD
jgi:alpha-glucuronidase